MLHVRDVDVARQVVHAVGLFRDGLQLAYKARLKTQNVPSLFALHCLLCVVPACKLVGLTWWSKGCPESRAIMPYPSGEVSNELWCGGTNYCVSSRICVQRRPGAKLPQAVVSKFADILFSSNIDNPK